MKTRISHLQFNVAPGNLRFYRDLFDLVGWRTIVDNEEMFSAAGANGESVWFLGQAKPVVNDYDGPGLNHLGIGADSVAEVDEAAAALSARGVVMLFETPRHRPEFSSPDNTYYQIMFESPDRILFEIVYIGAR